MKRSTERILSTHVGSLARPEALVPILRSMERGLPYDRDIYGKLVRNAVGDGGPTPGTDGAEVDIVTEGEQGKASFFGYIVERFEGFARKPAPSGQEGNPRNASRDHR